MMDPNGIEFSTIFIFNSTILLLISAPVYNRLPVYCAARRPMPVDWCFPGGSVEYDSITRKLQPIGPVQHLLTPPLTLFHA
jgi:hypothetical protein